MALENELRRIPQTASEVADIQAAMHTLMSGEAEELRKLMEIARDAGAAGVTMECVDYRNYSPAVCEVIRGFGASAPQPSTPQSGPTQ